MLGPDWLLSPDDNPAYACYSDVICDAPKP
jgi:hypothetical protein